MTRSNNLFPSIECCESSGADAALQQCKIATEQQPQSY